MKQPVLGVCCAILPGNCVAAVGCHYFIIVGDSVCGLHLGIIHCSNHHHHHHHRENF